MLLIGIFNILWSQYAHVEIDNLTSLIVIIVKFNRFLNKFVSLCQ